jgi:8-oxo-dGTP pyrophosphatase MutT (NUDIX family)
MSEELLQLLDAYRPEVGKEAAMWQRMREFVATTPDAFERTCLVGHVTGSAWIVNRDLSRVVLIHHAKLNRWLQPGGHCDGQTDVLAVAQREVLEETGLSVQPAATGIFDVDVHVIPARGVEPQHLHYDVRFLLVADETAALEQNSESRAVAWFELDDVAGQNPDASLARMIAKTRLQALCHQS